MMSLPHNFSLNNLHFYFNSFLSQLCYFIFLSVFGYLGLKVSKPRSPVRPNDLDLFYTSVSASTVSSMTAVEMEAFTNSQLILLTFLMFVGGEVFTSLIELVFARFNYSTKNHSVTKNTLRNTSLSHEQKPSINSNRVELGLVSLPSSHHSDNSDVNVPNGTVVSFNNRLKYNSLRYLSHIVFGYLLVVHFVGSILVSMYVTFIPSARQVLKDKAIKISTFSVFTIVSAFVSCGFVPTNENMIIFNKNSGLLLIVLPHVLVGSILYPACLRLVIWVLRKITKREEFSYMLKNSKEMGYGHLFTSLHCWLLVATVLGLNVVQFVIFCSMEWNSQNTEGMNVYQKIVASLFQVTNARHGGQYDFDLSTMSSAVLALFVVMMYLPPYTTFLPIRNHENNVKRDKMSLVEYIGLSNLSYLVIFIILICITERNSLREDPLNFNVLNITLEVISAYGSVGFSTGYSCARQLKPDATCKDKWVGFSGKWSSKGKVILILAMFLGRLKKFNMKSGKAWDLSA